MFDTVVSFAGVEVEFISLVMYLWDLSEGYSIHMCYIIHYLDPVKGDDGGLMGVNGCLVTMFASWEGVTVKKIKYYFV